ncbi:hypothetical protein DVK07_09370 [Halorubrum sp. Atlit-26R]|nr:hypothetical protein DVK07_09370 [Halorubrum sp. Atlit-26R]
MEVFTADPRSVIYTPSARTSESVVDLLAMIYKRTIEISGRSTQYLQLIPRPRAPRRSRPGRRPLGGASRRRRRRRASRRQ